MTNTPVIPAASSEKLVNLEDLISRTIKNFIASEEFSKRLHEIIDEAMNKKITQLEEKVTVLKKENSELKKENCDMKGVVNDLEQYGRRSNLRIFGLGKSQVHGNNLEEKVLNVFTQAVRVNVTPQDIEACHYLDKNETSVIVKFVSRKTRDAVFRNKKNLKGSKITITEDLTRSNYKLFKKCQEEYGKGKVWTWYGKIKVADANNQVKTVRNDQDVPDDNDSTFTSTSHE